MTHTASGVTGEAGNNVLNTKGESSDVCTNLYFRERSYFAVFKVVREKEVLNTDDVW